MNEFDPMDIDKIFDEVINDQEQAVRCTKSRLDDAQKNVLGAVKHYAQMESEYKRQQDKLLILLRVQIYQTKNEEQ